MANMSMRQSPRLPLKSTCHVRRKSNSRSHSAAERMLIPGQTYAVSIHSVLCSDCFYDAACYEYYQTRLLNRLRSFHCELHAFCLQPAAVYLLLTPRTPSGLQRLLSSLNDSYSEYYNLRFNRGSGVFATQPLLLTMPDNATCLEVQKYIERLPLDTGQHTHAGTHFWSSYRRHAFSRADKYLTPHRHFLRFLRLGPQPRKRYRDYVASDFNSQYWQWLNSSLQPRQIVSQTAFA